MKSIVVLGAGMIGRAMALDLSAKYSVTCADKDALALEKIASRKKTIKTSLVDVTDPDALLAVIQPADLVICAVPGFLGFETLRQIIKAGKHVVDISFFPEDAFELDGLAKENNVIAVVDCGVAPGMGNIILGYHHSQMKVTAFECLVGGLPKVKKWPFNYKAPFSPVDVIEEYTRPARFKENGQVVTKPALSDIEHVEFEGVGTLESFNSDGLRSLLTTMADIPDMKEKTLRYPGHADAIRMLRDSGFFSENPITCNGHDIRPIDFTSRVLFNDWKLGDDEPEITVMRITITGENKTITYTLFDEFDPITHTSSMARTTGYTATAVANLVLNGDYGQPGISPPEFIGGKKGCFEKVMLYLKERRVKYSVES